MRARLLTAILLVAGCDEGQVRPPPAPPPAPHAVTTDAAPAAPPELLGTKPATLGPAFAGLALGQAIDQQAADRFLKQRAIPATAFVRDGHLVSLRLDKGHLELHWPTTHGLGEDWFDPALHQHATEVVTEQGTSVQFDLEVPIEQWMNTSLQSIVPFDLVTTPFDDVERRVGLPTWSNYVDGRAHVSWIDSALAGAATATYLSVREVHSFRKTGTTEGGSWEIEEIPGATTHALEVTLDASPALDAAIVQRLTELFGKPVHDRAANADRWKHSKLVLTRTAADAGLEHLELSWQR